MKDIAVAVLVLELWVPEVGLFSGFSALASSYVPGT
jgi:hypothetical protein